jgi:hypothetical protein
VITSTPSHSIVAAAMDCRRMSRYLDRARGKTSNAAAAVYHSLFQHTDVIYRYKSNAGIVRTAVVLQK